MRQAASAIAFALLASSHSCPVLADKLVLARGEQIPCTIVGPKSPPSILASRGFLTVDLGDSMIVHTSHRDSTHRDTTWIGRTRAYSLDSLRFVTLDFGDHEESYTLRELRARSDTRLPLGLAVGANLNFLEGVKLSNVYANLDLYLPEVFFEDRPTWSEMIYGPVSTPPIKADGGKTEKGDGSETNKPDNAKRAPVKRPIRWGKVAEKIGWYLMPSGFSLGTEQGRLVGRDTSSALFVQLNFDSAGTTHFRDTTFSIVGEDKTDVTTLSFGVYWPIWHQKAKGRDVAVFAVLLNEFRRLEFSRTRFGAVFGKDPLTIPLQGTSQREALLSGGLAGSVVMSEFEARVLVTFRGKYEDEHLRPLPGVQLENRRGLAPYLVQGRLVSTQYGVLVGGEVRGLNMPQRTSADLRTFPEFEVYAAKVFSLDKLFDFITGPATSTNKSK